jgi:hypothetical protein
MYISQGQLTANLGSMEGTLGAQTATEILAIQQAEQARAQEAAKAQSQKTAASKATGSVVKGVGAILGAVGTIGAQFYAAHTQARLAEKRMKYEQRNQPAAPALDPRLIAALTQQPKSGGSSTVIIIAVVMVLALGVVGYLLMSGGEEGYGPESGVASPAYGSPPPQRRIKRVRRVRKKRKKRP